MVTYWSLRVNGSYTLTPKGYSIIQKQRQEIREPFQKLALHYCQLIGKSEKTLIDARRKQTFYMYIICYKL